MIVADKGRQRSRSGCLADVAVKVYGPNNLRIVDASILPKSPSANMNALSTMVVEKIADVMNHRT